MDLPPALLAAIEVWETNYAGAMAGEVVRNAWEVVGRSRVDDLAAVGHELKDLTCPSCDESAAFPIHPRAPVVRCLSCGLDRLLPRLTAAGSERLTNVQYDRMGRPGDLDGASAFFPFEFDHIKKFFPELLSGARCFEVGCWGGDFALQLKSLGIETVGIDVWPPGVDIAVRRGVKAHLVSFNNLSALERLNLEGVDLICFRDSLQMVHGLRRGLEFLKRTAKPGFALYVKCHVSDSAHYLGNRDLLQRFGIGAQSLFTSFSLTNSLERHGFDILVMAGQSPSPNYINNDRLFVFARLRPT